MSPFGCWRLDKYIISLAIFLAIFSTALAFPLSAPQVVEVHNDSNYFYADITNNTDTTQTVSVNFYSTGKTSISVPKSITPNSTIKAKITIFNDSIETYHERTSKLEVYVGNDLEEKQIQVKFYPKGSLTGEISKSVSGLFSLADFSKETTNFSVSDWIIFWVLVVIAAILLIAFMSRVVRRT